MITVTLNGVTIGGCGTDFVISESNVVGLGIPDVKALDLDLQSAHGNTASRDFLAQRTLGIPIIIYRKNDPTAAMAALRTLKTAWQPTNSGNNDDLLTVVADGIGPTNGTLSFFGRPRGGLEADLNRHHSGLINVFASFACLDPLGYGNTESTSGTSLNINNVGDATTDRITLTVTGNGGTPVITNTTDDGRAIRFGTTLAGAATRQIDVRNKTVLNGSLDTYSELSPTNQWFDLLPGVNSVTVTGASSINITWRPAWF